LDIKLHHNDLPDGLDLGDMIAVDSETMGLNVARDRLCLVQLSAGDETCHLVQFTAGGYDAPNLKGLFGDPAVTKLFHFARFDLAMIQRHLGVACRPVYCTKVASKLARTFTDRHSLRDLCRELLGVDLSKQQQSSDWGAAELSDAQLRYAASDVLYLHRLKAILDEMLEREGRQHLTQACFDFLPARAALDRSDIRIGTSRGRPKRELLPWPDTQSNWRTIGRPPRAPI
jgi:ribonuclease D